MIEFWDFFNSIRNIYHFSSQDFTSTELLFCYESPDTLLYNLWDCIQLQKLALSFLPSQTEQLATLSVIPESNIVPWVKALSHSPGVTTLPASGITPKVLMLQKWKFLHINFLSWQNEFSLPYLRGILTTH